MTFKLGGKLVTIYSLKEGNQNDDYQAVISILKWQGFPFTEVIDFDKTIRMGRGKFNPMGHGFVAMMHDGTIVRSPFQLASWFEQTGMIRLA